MHSSLQVFKPLQGLLVFDVCGHLAVGVCLKMCGDLSNAGGLHRSWRAEVAR